MSLELMQRQAHLGDFPGFKAMFAELTRGGSCSRELRKILLDAYFVSSEAGRDSFVKFLIYVFKHLDISVDSRAPDGRTALMAASDGGYIEIVEELLDAGADPCLSQPDIGFTPLHYAARSNHIIACKLLIAKGSHPEAGDANGMTASWWAGELGHDALLDALQGIMPRPASPQLEEVFTALRAVHLKKGFKVKTAKPLKAKKKKPKRRK